jgi:hypothetical protein
MLKSSAFTEIEFVAVERVEEYIALEREHRGEGGLRDGAGDSEASGRASMVGYFNAWRKGYTLLQNKVSVQSASFAGMLCTLSAIS